MKIVALCGLSRGAGGIFYAVSSLCKEMKYDNGIDLQVFGRNDPYVESDRAIWGGVETSRFNAYGPFQNAPKLRCMLGAAAPDLTHMHGIWLDDQRATLQWQTKTGHPVVISPHGMLDPWALKNSAWKKKLVGALFANESLRRANCIHALCRSEIESIRAYGLTNPIALIPNGVELPSLTSAPSPPTSGVKRKLLFLGRIHPKKGLEELLHAWAQTQCLKSKASSEWELLIAGWDDGNHLAGLKKLASQLDLSWSDDAPSSVLCPPSSDICFVGPQFGSEKENLLRSVDAFVLPSFSEGLPMSVLEAWSYGLPVVMTDFCNLPEGFVADAAIRVEPNRNSIAQGVGKLAARSDAELKAMGAQGRKLIEEKFTWPRISGEMKQVYEWCLTGEAPPDCMEFY